MLLSCVCPKAITKQVACVWDGYLRCPLSSSNGYTSFFRRDIEIWQEKGIAHSGKYEEYESMTLIETESRAIWNVK